jgi:adenosylcobinamide-GDP ribazoletransferase
MSDDFEPLSEARRGFRPFAEFLVALRFLTVLPVPFVRTLDPPPLSEAMRMFPLAGALVGATTGAVLGLCKLGGLPPLFSAAFAIGIGLLITGALHEDGLSDVADGFGGGRTREERLDIMRDSRIGAFGTLGLGVMLLARAALFMALVELPLAATVILLACAAAFSRALVVDLMWATAGPQRRAVGAAGRPSRNPPLFAALGGIGAGAAAGAVLAPAAGVAP